MFRVIGKGSFEPQIVPKHQRRLAGLDDAVICLYAKGMTTGDIAAHLGCPEPEHAVVANVNSARTRRDWCTRRKQRLRQTSSLA